MSTPRLGRNARLFKDGTVIDYAKSISAEEATISAKRVFLRNV